MQQATNLYILDKIIHAIDITSDGRLLLNTQPQNTYILPEATVEVNLFYNLYNTLYTHFYTGHENKENPKKQIVDKHFLENLQKANLSREKFDEGWLVEEVGYNGSILIKKGAAKRYTYSGDFLRANYGQGALQKGEGVKLFNKKEYANKNESGFYFVFGETVLDNNNSTLIRLYFNLKSTGAKKIIQLLTTIFNNWQIPFQFKCLQEAQLYQRADSAVLYLDKRYQKVAIELLQTIYPHIKNSLKKGTPLFTKFVAKGIGFAENPFSAEESFGTSRCKIIAQGLIEAWKQKKAKTEWLSLISKEIEKNYLNINTLYLNPNSKYPYHFPNFENLNYA